MFNLIRGQSVWDLGWTNWNRGKLYSGYFGPPTPPYHFASSP